MYTHAMQKVCANSWCGQSFEITEKDLAFYEKISPQFLGEKQLIPPPTLCPDCRNQRRMSWRNDRTFYRRTCDLSGEQFISIYPAETPFPVFRPDVWYGDGWDPQRYGVGIDTKKPFFPQFETLMKRVPRLGIDIVNCENSNYCNYCGDDKNCYLDIAGEANEDCFYNLFTKYSKHCVDCTFVYYSTLCFQCINCHNCYAVRHSQYLEDCADCTLCFDCKGCKNCALCINLRNKQYCIGNRQLTKDGYEQELQALKLDTADGERRALKRWSKESLKRGIFRDMYCSASESCSGNDIKNSKNCRQAFNIVNCEDSGHLYDVLDAADCRDLNYSLYKPEASYELISTLSMKFSAFNLASHYCTNTFYSQLCNHCSDIFGCIGLTHKQYCILNKQYTKEEYQSLVPKLIEQMRKNGEWGEFFPTTLSPHGYNETVAQEYSPINKEEALNRHWKWLDQMDEIPKADRIIPANQLPDAIDDIPDDILHWAIECEATKRPFKIIKQELDFYRTMKVPVPRFHPDERHRQRMALRNPRQLWNRQCSKCEKAIATSSAPKQPEQVYCEECYLKEVY